MDVAQSPAVAMVRDGVELGRRWVLGIGLDLRGTQCRKVAGWTPAPVALRGEPWHQGLQ
jgi:hypothetical protein